MKLKDAPEVFFGKFGVNQMFLREWSITDGQYGKQLEFNFVFSQDDEKTKKYWHGFSDKFEEKNTFQFIKKLRQINQVLAAFIGQEKADARFELVKTKLFEEDFDNTDKESVQKIQERFVAGLFAAFPSDYQKLPIEVVLHYNNAGYLNIPSYKENGWEIPCGLNPVVSGGLTSVKPAQNSAPASENGEISEGQEVTHNTSSDDDTW